MENDTWDKRVEAGEMIPVKGGRSDTWGGE